jgi:hypothetical protein
VCGCLSFAPAHNVRASAWMTTRVFRCRTNHFAFDVAHASLHGDLTRTSVDLIIMMPHDMFYIDS